MTVTTVERPPWKKALLIGINYPDSSNRLEVPHKDVAAMKKLLIGTIPPLSIPHSLFANVNGP